MIGGGLAIIGLFVIYLLVGGSIIINTRLIEFFGALSLLLVFEFLNLLVNVVLEQITNHSPVAMFLALVCIAAMVLPLHHKLEKWTTRKMMERNKKIRLDAAKKKYSET